MIGYSCAINLAATNPTNMNKATRFALTTGWLLFSRGYDAYCTNLYTPDLSREANPLVSMLGLSWTPLLLILAVLTLYVVYAHYVAVFRPMSLLPREQGYSFSNIVAYTYHGQKDEWYSIFYKFPKDLRRLNNYMGHVLMQSLVFAGIVSTVMWVLLNHTEFYKKIHSAWLIYALLIGGCGVITYVWSRKQYGVYLRG